MKPKIEVDFNELIDNNHVLLSQNDIRKDVYGNEKEKIICTIE